jgi:hypothetical protein
MEVSPFNVRITIIEKYQYQLKFTEIGVIVEFPQEQEGQLNLVKYFIFLYINLLPSCSLLSQVYTLDITKNNLLTYSELSTDAIKMN